MPIIPSPYRGMVPRWLEEMGAQPPGPAVLEGPKILKQILKAGSPQMFRVLEQLPRKIRLGIGETDLAPPSLTYFGFTRGGGAVDPLEIMIRPEYARLATEAMKRHTLVHEGGHALRRARGAPHQDQGTSGWGYWPSALNERLVEGARRSQRFPPGYVDLLQSRTGTGEAAIDLLAHELLRRSGSPVLPRNAAPYKSVSQEMRRLRSPLQ